MASSVLFRRVRVSTPFARRWASFIVTCVSVALPTIAIAAPGLLDPTFGGGGTVVTSFAPLEARLNGIVVQPDGKIIVAGGTAEMFYDNFTLARYDLDGSLDPTFGSGGIVVTPTFGYNGDARALLLQPDGKILAAGLVQTNGFGLVRYDASGALDPTFGSGGIAAVGFGGNPLAAALQPDGKILVGGSVALTARGSGGVVVRFDADGSPDATFGTGGIVEFDALGVFALAVQADRRIVLAGTDYPADGAVTAKLARLTADGTFDASLGSGGVTIPVGDYAQAKSVAVQPDGKIVVGGAACLPGNNACQAFVARYQADGTLDAAFGDGGLAAITIGARVFVGNGAHALALQPDGRIVVGGNASLDSATEVFALARLLPGGTLDPSFAGGTTTVPIGQEADAVAVAPDGAVVVAGPACFLGQDGTLDCSFAVARLRDCACPTCETCDAGGSCIVVPRSTCHQGTAASRARLTLRHGPGGDDHVTWRLHRGPQTRVRRLGSPVDSDDYALCVYDAAPEPHLLLHVSAPAAGTCGGRPCWRAQLRRFEIFLLQSMKKLVYANTDGSADGLTGIQARPGADGATRLTVMGGGDHLTLPSLPVAAPLRVQLQIENGECWETTFDDADVRRDDASELDAQHVGP